MRESMIDEIVSFAKKKDEKQIKMPGFNFQRQEVEKYSYYCCIETTRCIRVYVRFVAWSYIHHRFTVKVKQTIRSLGRP